MNKKFYIIILLIFGFLNITCEKEVFVSPEEQPAPQGFLHIKTAPEGMLIFHNGRNTGRRTPDSLPYIAPGIHEITLKRNYLKDSTFFVNLDNIDSIYLDYYANPTMYGTIRITTLPVGATIIFNDSLLTEKTPHDLKNIFGGVYKAVIKANNHIDDTLNVVARSSQLTTFSSVLRDTSVWLEYRISNNSGIPTNNLTAIDFDDNNIKWIGTTESGLLRFNEREFISFNTSNSLIPSNSINKVVVSPLNEVWVSTNNGIGVYNGSSWRVYNSSNSGLISDTVYTVKFINNIAWIGASSGLYRFDGVNWSRYFSGIHTKSVEGELVDTLINVQPMDIGFFNNKIWIASRNSGLVLFENEEFKFYLKEEYNFLSNRLTAIKEDASGNIWLAQNPDFDSMYLGGISIFNGTSFFNLYSYEVMSANIYDIYIDETNNKFISMNQALHRFTPNNTSLFYTITNTLISNNRISDFEKDKNGIFWITTLSGGLNKLKSIP